jgi:hypothetical protein
MYSKVLVERCLLENIKEKIRYKKTIEDVWRYLECLHESRHIPP